MAVLWVLMMFFRVKSPYGLVGKANFQEKRAVSIFRAEIKKFQSQVLWVVVPCSPVVAYKPVSAASPLPVPWF
jgi:hypothetical protein